MIDRGTAGLRAAGLAFEGLVDLDVPLIPPALATLAISVPPGPQRTGFSESLAEPDLFARANHQWFVLACGELFDEEQRRFLVAVQPAAEEESPTWRWARVRMAAAWDLMGAGCQGPLGYGAGRPAFVMLSLDGRVIVLGETFEESIGCVRVRDPHTVDVFRRRGSYLIEQRTMPDVYDRAAIRRWLDHVAGHEAWAVDDSGPSTGR